MQRHSLMHVYDRSSSHCKQLPSSIGLHVVPCSLQSGDLVVAEQVKAAAGGRRLHELPVHALQVDHKFDAAVGGDSTGIMRCKLQKLDRGWGQPQNYCYNHSIISFIRHFIELET